MESYRLFHESKIVFGNECQSLSITAIDLTTNLDKDLVSLNHMMITNTTDK